MSVVSRAEEFARSLGTNTHSSFTYAPHNKLTVVTTWLTNLGVRVIRDKYAASRTDISDFHKAMYDAGCQIHTTVDTPSTTLPAIKASYPAGSAYPASLLIRSVGNQNEPNNTGAARGARTWDWAVQYRDIQKVLFNTVNGDSALTAIKVASGALKDVEVTLEQDATTGAWMRLLSGPAWSWEGNGTQFTVASQAAMLALPDGAGKIAIRTDVSDIHGQANCHFKLTATVASTLANWDKLEFHPGLLSPALSSDPISAYVEIPDYHKYPGGANTPSVNLAYTQGLANQAYSGSGKQFYCTETGYHTALNNAVGGQGVPTDVQGKYLMTLWCEHYKYGLDNQGVGNVAFQYELLDGIDHTTTHEDSFGLIAMTSLTDETTWTAKPAYTAFKNMLTIIGDRSSAGPGAAGARLTHTLANLGLTITGGAAHEEFLLQKADGSYWLVIWREVKLYTPSATPPRNVIAPVSATVTAASSWTWQVFTPYASPNGATATTGTSKTFDLGEDVLVVKISGGSTVTGSYLLSESPAKLAAFGASAASPLAVKLQNVVVGTPPTAPVATAGTVTIDSIPITWTASTAPADAPVQSYIVSIQQGTATTVTNTTVAATARAFTFPGLASGVAYTVWVHAVNRWGDGPASNKVTRTTVGGLVPLAPASLTFTPTAPTANVTLTWTAPGGSGGGSSVLFNGHVPNRVLMGMGTPDNSSPYDPGWTEAQSIVGQRVYVARRYSNLWIDATAFNAMVAEADAAGAIPFISFRVPTSDFAGVAAGTYNADLLALFNLVKTYNKPILCSFNHEPPLGTDLAAWSAAQRYCTWYFGGRRGGAALSTYVAANDVRNLLSWAPMGNGYWWKTDAVWQPTTSEANAGFPQVLIDALRVNKGVVLADFNDGPYVDPVLALTDATYRTPDPTGARTHVRMDNFMKWVRLKNTGAVGCGEFAAITGSEITAAWNTMDANRDLWGVAAYFNSTVAATQEARLVPADYPIGNPTTTPGGLVDLGGNAQSANRLAAFQSVLSLSESGGNPPGEPLTAYRVRNPATGALLREVGPTVMSTQFTGLAAATDYAYEVHAVNQYGEGAASPSISFRT